MFGLLILVLVASAAADTWDDFSNNLATDLAPLITLFGESVTKQWLSESTDVLDLIIFALLPLGILTAVVSAIRVCGNQSLKAFIGRAQEADGVAEAELCSSTGLSVCELWSKGGISRVFGRPKILEIVHERTSQFDDFYPTISTQEGNSTVRKWDDPTCGLTRPKEYFPNATNWKELGPTHKERDNEQDFAENPNLSLNIGITKTSPRWLWCSVAFAALLQVSVFAFASWATFIAKLKKSGQSPPLWSFCLVVVGTVSLGIGMFLCAHLINQSTKERKFERMTRTKETDRDDHMFWLQPGGQFVGDQAFDAFAFSASLDKYITSRRVIRTYSQYTTLWAALVLSILGFVLQFVGLRNVHSSVAMFLLVATLIMAVLRASLRSNRLEEKSNRLAEIEKVEGHELDWLACELESSLLAHEDPSPSPDTSKVDVTNSWELPGDDTSKSKLAACPPNHHETTSLLSAEIRKSPQLNQTADKIIQVKEYEEAEGTPQSPDCKWRIVRDGHERVFTIYEEELPYKAFALASSGDAVYDSQFIEGRGFEMIKHRERGEKNSWLPNPAACAMRLRARLATLTGDPATVATKWDINTREVGLKLQNSFCATAEYLLSPHNTWIGPHNCVVFGWSTNSWVGRKGKSLVQYPIHFLLRKQNAKWVTSAEQLEAVVGLWVWSLKETNPHHLRYLFEVLEDEKRRYLATSTLRMWTAQVDISFERGVPTSSSGKLSKHAWFLLADEGGPSQPFPAACFSGSNTTSSPIRGCLLSPYQTNSSNLKAAQSIFAIFIAVISKFVEPLGPEKAIDEWLLKQSSLTGLARLVDIFISAELGNRADALMTIIPPLLASSWLPSINEMMGWAIEQGRLDAVMFLLKSEAVDFKMKDENEETVKERSGTRRGSEIPNIGEIYVQIEKAQGAVEEREKREEEIRVEKRVEQRRAEIEWAEEQEREYWRIRVENGPAWYGI